MVFSDTMSQKAMLRAEYWARINRAIDHIDRHLDSDLSLQEIAVVACFSPFHFHRIFGALVGETLKSYIARIRLERAATILTANRKKSITEVALECGFTGPAVFARAFREMFGMNATQWRCGGFKDFSKWRKPDSKICKTDSNACKDADDGSSYIDGARKQCGYNHQQRRRAMDRSVQVRVEEWPETKVAYVRYIGPYKGDEKLFAGLFEKLMRWAGPRGYTGLPDAKVLIIYHDNPEMTDDNKLRTSVCISVPEHVQGEGEIGTMSIPPGKYAMGHFELSPDEYQQAWDFMCGEWLPESGYQPDERPAFELCLGDPAQHPEHKHVVDICIPVIPL